MSICAQPGVFGRGGGGGGGGGGGACVVAVTRLVVVTSIRVFWWPRRLVVSRLKENPANSIPAGYRFGTRAAEPPYLVEVLLPAVVITRRTRRSIDSSFIYSKHRNMKC